MLSDPIKETLNMMPYGFYAVTSKYEDDVNIMVANWLTQVSFTPRLVALGLAKKAYSHNLVKKGRVFAVNIFNKEEVDIIRGFTKSRAKNPDKVKNAEFSTAPETGCPVIRGAAAYFECKVVSFLDVGGDHSIVVGEVVGAEVMKPGGPEDSLTLPFIGWDYAG